MSSDEPNAAAEDGGGRGPAHDGDMPDSSSADHLGGVTLDVDSECAALLAWVQAVAKASSTSQAKPIFSRHVADVGDLCDGTVFFELLASIDDEYYRNPHAHGNGGSEAADTNWVLKTATLKRLYKLIIQYYAEVLRQSPQALTVPDLDSLARNGSHAELARLGRFVLGVAVRSEHADQHISAIQTLDLGTQQQLMHTIEQVMSALEPLDGGHSDTDRGEVKSSASQETLNATDRALAAEKQKFEQSYQDLLQKQRALQSNLDDVITERDEAQRELQQHRENDEQAYGSSSDKALRQDIERLKDELRRSEDNYAEVERELQSLTSSMGDISKRNSDMQSVVQENARLKDQVEELTHAADKLQRTENVMEKYKKKLEEGSEIRRQFKTLEEQNAVLIERNTTLEEDYRRIAHLKPLVDSYKTQVSELETKASDFQRDLNTARYETEQIAVKLRVTEEARIKEKEELDLYQERVQELELGGPLPKRDKLSAGLGGVDVSAGIGNEEDLAGETLQDAMSSSTMAGLKIQIRKLRSELASAQANKADASKLLVTENLLQDANAMKARYEKDYLREYQAAMKLRKQLEEVESGKSDHGDGTEANVALRIRLSETITALDNAKMKLIDLESEHDRTCRDLVLAKSDQHLIGKDRQEMIAEVRASISTEKAELDRQVMHLRKELDGKNEEALMHLSQINTLLMDKVDLQSNGIDQRDSALQHQAQMEALRQKGESVSGDVQRQLNERDEEIKTLREKLGKARAFVRQQDRLLKESGNLSSAASSSAAGEDEAASSSSSKRTQSLEQENKLLRQEQRLMAAAWHDLNMRYMRTVGGNALSPGAMASLSSLSLSSGRAQTRASVELNGSKPKSWLLQQRSQLAPGISLSRR